MEPEHGAGAKDLFKLILHSPALLVTFLVGIALVIYFLVKYGPSSSQNAGITGSGVSGAAAPTATVIPQTSIYVPQYVPHQSGPGDSSVTTPIVATTAQTVTPPSVSTPPSPVNTTPAVVSPVASTPTVPSPVAHGNLANIRTKGSIPTVATYDAKFTGVPIRSAAGAGNDQIGTIAFGSQVQLTGKAIQGTSNLPGSANGTNLWYPVTYNGKTGYVSAFDVNNA
ncbi:MAG TPA: SH3 domain-containing protein [Ktedonobacteraceae bacterium]|nr:SH3 domain-containing protein [Ktedonobacteraceae bacterium]